MTVDTVALKQRIDLQGLIERYTTLQGGPKEYYGPCPKPGCGGTDRFHFRPDKGWFCRHCTGDPSVSGWHDQIDLVMLVHGVNFVEAYEMLSSGDLPALTPELIAEREARRQQEQAEQREKQEQRRTELDHSGAWQEYHQNLDKFNARYLWHERGLTDQWIDYYKFGFSPSRKFFYGKDQVYEGASLTIPTFHVDLVDGVPQWRCVSLVHRVLGEDPPCGKYRPHLANTGKVLFRTDLSDPGITGPVLLVEGEIKAAVAYARVQDEVYRLAQQGQDTGLMGRLTVVGTAGKGFKRESAGELSQATDIWLCFDPDASREAENAAAILGPGRCRIIELTGKIDDMFTEGSLTVSDLHELLVTARRL